MGKPILCVDFDGVIHSYTSPWTDAVTIADPPTKGALKWLWSATEWFDVQVYSSRSKDPHARAAMREWMGKWSELEFPLDHPMNHTGPQHYPITFAHEKPAAFLTIDDRAICFEGDWNDLDPADLLNFKPWNKRPFGATGAFPDGQLGDEDEGELKIGIARDPIDGLVHINLGKPTAWFAVPPETAINLAKALLKHAGVKGVELHL